jgi:hypothetical protein
VRLVWEVVVVDDVAAAEVIPAVHGLLCHAAAVLAAVLWRCARRLSLSLLEPRCAAAVVAEPCGLVMTCWRFGVWWAGLQHGF